MDTVLFDLDGTLLDTTQAIFSSLRHTMKHFTGNIPPDHVLQDTMGIPLIEVLESLIPGRAQEAAKVYVDHNLNVHKNLVQPYPGVHGTLETLKKAGLRLGVVTSKRRHSAQIGLKSAEIDSFFEVAICHDDAPKHKPDPTPILMALEFMDVTSGCVLMVGDTIFDVRAAKNADTVMPGLRVKSAAVTYGAGLKESLVEENPDFLLDSICQVLDVCQV